MSSGIYVIENTLNGHQYVGSAVNLERRRRQHWSDLRLMVHGNPHLQYAWNKYGPLAFEFRAIGECPPDRLIALEQEVMDHLRPEYNMLPLAASSLGAKRSPETRKRIGDVQRGKPKGPPSIEHRQAISRGKLGKLFSESHKANLRLNHRGMTGRSRSQETRDAIRASVRRYSEAERFSAQFEADSR